MSSSTSSSSAPRPPHIVARLMLFLLPFAVFPGAPIALAAMAGELTPLPAVAARQMREPVLYGRAYWDDFFAFKLISAEMRKPDTLVLGSSRVMQFRAATVGVSGARFYNAGGAARSPADSLEFYRRLRQTAIPRELILGLDQVWFLQPAAFDPARLPGSQPDTVRDPRRMIRLSQRVVSDLRAGRIAPRRLFARRDPATGATALGVTAIMLGGGFRSDGSYQYGLGRGIDRPLSERLAEGYERIAQGIVPMTRAAALDPATLSPLRDLLVLARQDGVRVTGFAPPFAPSLIAAMRRDGGYGYLAQLGPVLERLFAEYGYRFTDLSDPSALGVGDADMIDYFHPSEDVIGRVYGTMRQGRLEAS